MMLICTLGRVFTSIIMKNLLFLYVFCLFLLSCDSGTHYTGKASVDEPWGTSIAEFKNGAREGSMVNLFSNGMTRDSETYVNDKVNGRIFHYDSSGVLASEEYSYFGIRVGPRMAYK